MRKWQLYGVAPSPIDMDVIYDALLAQSLAIPPGKRPGWRFHRPKPSITNGRMRRPN
jgi:hypothetical protein